VTPRTLSRLKLLGIGAIAVAPVLGSYLLYWFWSPDSYTNYGDLMQPRPAPAVAMQSYSGEAFAFAQLKGRWTFVVLDSGQCDAACEQKLWKIRQVRQAQGKEVGRVERVFLLEDGQVPRDQIRADYAGTWFLRANEAQLAEAFPAPGSPRNHIYLVDPLGNVILRFPQDADPKRMIKDVARLLKYSRVG
jgi:cytochrome oxidase Cu insertion factor (SCO1/SenC/PrrC family)